MPNSFYDENVTWGTDESNFNYQKLEAGEELIGKYDGIGFVPFEHVKIRTNENDVVGIPIYYQLQRFIETYQVQKGLLIKIVMKDQVDIGKNKTLNQMDISFDKRQTDLFQPPDETAKSTKQATKKKKGKSRVAVPEEKEQQDELDF